MKRIKWAGIPGTISSKNYTCGYCGTPIASEKGWSANDNKGQIYICHLCTRPTFFDNIEGAKQFPGVVHGNPVSDIPDKTVSDLYEEARNCTGVCAFTAAILCCRKLLMHVAVSKGAATGKSFLHYVDFLADQHFVHSNQWRDRKDTISQGRYRISPTDAINESFCSSLQRIVEDGFSGFLKRKNVMACQY